MRNLASFLIGLVFGLGLVISGMANPARVIGFLDVAGQWDPTLLFVMAGAFAVTFIGYRLVRLRARPILDSNFHLPTKTAIDRSLIFGAAVFGVGWGMAGFCPGPGVAALATGGLAPVLFVAAMLLGMALHAGVNQRLARVLA